MSILSRLGRVAAIAVVFGSFACSDGTTPTIPSAPAPLAGLQLGTTNDSGTAPVVTQPSTTPGYFRGTILGHSSFPAGTDTLAVLPRIAGAVLTAHTRGAKTATDPVGVGPTVATVTTDANGKFQFQSLPGGEYVVTIAPPAGSKYQGIYVLPVADVHSADFPWWVVLPLR